MKRTISLIAIIVVNIILDQVSKVVVRAQMKPGEVIEVIGDMFILTNVENSGAFLGFGSHLNPTLKLILLLVLPVVVLLYVIYYVFKSTHLPKIQTWAFCLIIGGGIANIFDRIAFGSVTDFLHLDFGGFMRTGIFNIADVFITTGMIMLLMANLGIGNSKKIAIENEDEVA